MAVRKTHVRRFYGRDDNRDVWVDVRRVDEYETRQGQGLDYQKITHRLRWYADDGVSDNPTRRMLQVAISNPEDESQVIDLPAIEKMTVVQRGFSETQYQLRNRQFRNEDGSSRRVVTVRRVTHRDVVEEPDEDGFFEEYTYVDGSEDDSQYVDFEVIEKVETREGQGPGFQRTFLNMRYEDYEDLFEESPSDADEPVRLDPFQGIVNVQWGHPFLALSSSGIIGRSSDGIEWVRAGDPPGPAPFVGAYGNGMFVVARGSPPTLYQSTDGARTWSVMTGHPFASGYNIRGVAFGNGRFTVFAFDEATGRVGSTAATERGEEWFTGTVPGDASVWNDAELMAFSGGKFLAVTEGAPQTIIAQEIFAYVWLETEQYPIYGEPREFTSPAPHQVYHSTNGVTWNGPHDPVPGVRLPFAEDSTEVTFVNPATGEEVTVPRYVPALPFSAFPLPVGAVVRYGPKDGPMMLGVSNGAEGSYSATSTDGSTWSPTILGDELAGGPWAWGRDIFVGHASRLGESTSIAGAGTGSWSRAPLTFVPNSPPAFGKDIFVMAGGDEGNKIYTSENGLTWTEQTHGLGDVGTFFRVIY